MQGPHRFYLFLSKGVLKSKFKVEESSSSLSSNDAFILETPNKTWIWKGKDCVEEEIEQAVRLTDIVSPGREVVEVNEGEEDDNFWEAVGGKSDYNLSEDAINKPILQPRQY